MTDKIITVPIMNVDVPNLNGRTYPRGVVEKAIMKYNALPSKLGMLGMESGANIDLSKVSHVIEDLSINEKGEVIAKMRILDTPCGKIVKQLLDTPARCDFRTAGTANIDRNGVVSDYVLTSVNLVSDGA